MINVLFIDRMAPGSLGYGDPRKLQKYLQSKGIKCWIDYEQINVVKIDFY